MLRSFLLVRYQLDHILGVDDPQDALTALEHLPTDLSSAYSKILDRIQAKNSLDAAFRIFSWLYHAREPFRMDELREALSIQKGNTKLNPKLFIDGKTLLRRCEGLVLHDTMSDEVRFAHFTVFEYLQHHRIENILKPIELSKVSLQYLITAANLFRHLSEPPRPSKTNHLRFLSCAFLNFGFWAREDCQTELEFWKLLLELHESPNALRTLHWMTRKNYIFCRSNKCQVYTLAHFLLLTRESLASVCEILFRVARDENGLPKQLTTIKPRLRLLAEFCESNIDSKCFYQGTPLTLATLQNDVRFMKLLIRYGADVNEPDGLGRRAVHLAKSRSSLEVLHSAGADLSCTTEYGETPLHYAISTDNYDCIKYLLDQGCNVESTPSPSILTTPLHSAARGGLASFKLLLQAIPHALSQLDTVGRTPVYYAASGRDLRTLELLLSMPEMDLAIRDRLGYAPLHQAAGAGKILHVKLLLDAGADLTITDDLGLTPLDVAILALNTPVARVLFDRWRESNPFKELQLAPNTEAWRLGYLLSRIEEIPSEFKFYLAVGRIYAEQGSWELASQFFDKGTYLLSKLSPEMAQRPIYAYYETTGRFWCQECADSGSGSRYQWHTVPCYQCWTCESLHTLCEPCFQLLQTSTSPPEYFVDHVFHRIPSKDYPTSISAFIESVERSSTSSGPNATAEIINPQNESQASGAPG
jgi:ankyrin repeat protein